MPQPHGCKLSKLWRAFDIPRYSRAKHDAVRSRRQVPHSVVAAVMRNLLSAAGSMLRSSLMTWVDALHGDREPRPVTLQGPFCGFVGTPQVKRPRRGEPHRGRLVDRLRRSATGSVVTGTHPASASLFRSDHFTNFPQERLTRRPD
jgi:hypothetical protein